MSVVAPTNSATEMTFSELGLSPELCAILAEIGYEVPTPVQARAIPVIRAGRDLIAQAQTGTGKTAAFALPALDTLDLSQSGVQVLILTPTRELAIQVAEAFKTYGRKQKRFHVLPIYGGQAISTQLHGLARKPQVIVGTPGRVMDHLRRGSLSLDTLKTLVLDEADEMLSMGFLDDIIWIMDQSPVEKQTALFSATMPKAIKNVAEQHLRNPEHIVIAHSASEKTLIDQSHWVTSGLHKLDALTRILEVGEVDGTLIFVRTKTATIELAEKLEARGYSAGALNGDMSQEARERTIENFKRGRLDVLVATDVAARGIHVDRINYVINYDIPFDVETYTHRVGRTGRAGRSGIAILFVSPREYNLLKAIERTTGQRIPPFKMPSRADLVKRRIDRFVTKVQESLAHTDLAPYQQLVTTLTETTKAPLEEISAALCALLHSEAPLFVEESEQDPLEQPKLDRPERPARTKRGDRPERDRPERSRGDRPFKDRPSGHRFRKGSGKSGGGPRGGKRKFRGNER